MKKVVFPPIFARLKIQFNGNTSFFVFVVAKVKRGHTEFKTVSISVASKDCEEMAGEKGIFMLHEMHTLSREDLLGTRTRRVPRNINII